MKEPENNIGNNSIDKDRDSNSRSEKEARREKFKKISAALKLCLLLIIVVAIPAYIFFFQRDFLQEFSSLEDVENFFMQYRHQSMLIYFGLQILQIVICIIPGQTMQFAAGYIFHFWIGFMIAATGAFIGTIITYYLARILGRDAMHMIFGEAKINDMLHKINSKKGVAIVFLIYLIPGIPKDLCTYAAGLSEMKIKPFLILSMVGRMPGMIGSLLMGQQVHIGGYTSAAIIASCFIVMFVLGIFFRSKVTDFLDGIYVKLSKMM